MRHTKTETINHLLTSEARGAFPGGGARPGGALGAGGADSRLHVDVGGGALLVGELHNAEQGEHSLVPLCRLLLLDGGGRGGGDDAQDEESEDLHDVSPGAGPRQD